MAKTKQKLIILDANALIHRAWHALPPLTDSQGRVVNAAFGFTSVLLKMINELSPEFMVVAFDLPGKTFRHEEFEEYKATRVKQPDEFYEQIPLVKEILDSFNIPYFEKAGYEADDVIGTISKILDPNKNVKSVIVTGDLDALQLVDDNTEVLTFVKGLSETRLYDEKEVKEKYGFGPELVVDYKAIKGDPSDNIPGVSGIGDKGAKELIAEHGNLEKIYQALEKEPDKFKKSIANKLKEGKKSAKLSKELATIITDVKLNFDLEKCRVGSWDREQLVSELGRLGFKSLLSKLPGQDNTKKQKNKKAKQGTREINNLTEIGKMAGAWQSLAKEKEIAFLIKTEDAGLFGSRLSAIAVFAESGQTYFNLEKLTKDELAKFWQEAAKIFENEKIKKIGYNLKKDINILAGYDIKLSGLGFDAMVASYLLASGTRSHDLESIILQELGKELPQDGPAALAATCEYVMNLKDKLYPRLKKDGLISLFEKIEMPLIPVLAKMEQNGIKINTSHLKKMSNKVDRELKKISQKIYKLAGQEFNINSPLQLKEVLFEKLEIPSEGIRRGKTGLSTAAPELEKLRHLHPIIDLIFEQRELAKLKSTYIDALPLLVDKQTGRLHTTYNQTVTATGRLSSSSPNLQNIPIRSELGREIRQAFIAEKGNILLGADYSQIELRIVAALANDKKMIQAFESGKDIHTATAAAIWNVEESKVDKEMRRAAKAINFGVIYGQGPRGLAASADISFGKAKEFIDKYFQAYQGIKNYLDQTKALARRLGYVETIFGRRRYLPDIKSNIQQIRAAAERMAINMPVQGTAADIMKMAMIRVHQGLPKVSNKAKIILQVHDELVFEVPRSDIEKVAQFAKEEMESVHKLKVPVVVDVEAGDNWGEMTAASQGAKEQKGKRA